MRNIIIALTALLTLCLTACAQSNIDKNTGNMNKKILVAYFSATGTTRSVARQIASATDGTLMEIEPVETYTDADLDWRDKQSRSSVEMHNLDFRPAIKNKKNAADEYDVDFIGFPIWWDLAPTAVNTFIESNNLQGKTVIPFATSGGSTISNSVKELKKQYPDINWTEGRLLNGVSQKAVGQWVKSLGL